MNDSNNSNSPTLSLLVAAKALQSTKLAPHVAQARAATAPGSYRVEATLRVSATCTVGEDFDRRRTQSVPWQDLFALALSKLNGVTAEALVREALATEHKAPAALKEQVATAIEQIRGTTWERQSGAVRLSDLEVEVV